MGIDLFVQWRIGGGAPKIKLQTTLSLTQKNVLPERKIYFVTDFRMP